MGKKFKKGPSINLLGKKFGSWTVHEPHYLGKNKRWRCVCDCGTEQYLNQTDLIKGKSTKCKKCKGKETFRRLCIDLTGKEIGEWTVIERVGTNKHRRPIWRCKCKCGKESNVVSSNLIQGLTKKMWSM